MKFTVTVEMKDRWVPHFLGMLRKMQYLGNIGSSRRVSFISDGDGDFRPKFEWDKSLPEPAKAIDEGDPNESHDHGYTFDAG